MNMKKLLIIIGVVAIILPIVIIFFTNQKIVLKVYEDYDPPSSYNIEINPHNKKMYVKETKYSSALCGVSECEPDIEEKNIILTDEEFKLIKEIFRKLLSKEEKEQLAEALSSIADDEEVMFNKEDYMFEDEDDLNNDGIVTSREFGFNWLKHIKNGD